MLVHGHRLQVLLHDFAVVVVGVEQLVALVAQGLAQEFLVEPLRPRGCGG